MKNKDKKTPHFKIFHQNIASILSKLELLEITLQELQEIQNDPDIICLSETFLKSGYENYLKINNFVLAAAFCREQRRGGTCILAKRGIVYNKLSFIEKYAVQKKFEVCGIEIPLHKLLIICIYRTPTSDPNIFLEKLNTILFEINNKYKRTTNIVLIGDFNINTLQPGIVTKKLQDLCNNNNLQIHIDVPTRKESCIDHILSNIKEARADVLPLQLSDHDTAQLLSLPVLKTHYNKPKSYYRYKKDYCADNVRKFKECLNCLSWTEIYKESDLNLAFHNFHESLCLYYNLCFPSIRQKVTNDIHDKQKWISRGLKISCKTKRSLRYKYYANKTIANRTKYLSYAALLKKCIHNSKQQSNIKFINNSKNKCRATWTVIQEQISNANQQDNITSIKTNNSIITDPVDIATAFNNNFINTTNTPLSNDMEAIVSNKNTITNSLYLSPMSEHEVKREIMSLNNTGSEGYDGISTRIIKESIEQLIAILTHLINLSFYTGIFPEVLKLSIVRPIHKKGNKEDIDNYRQITLIPILSKVLEKCMYKRLIDFCIKFNVISGDQYGFQRRKSTSLAIYNLTNQILSNLNRNRLTTGLFLDLSRAFDFVSHKILLGKLEKMGIRGIAHKWLSTYLTERRQHVVIKKIEIEEERSYSSEPRINKFGVPQGSILGPILFLLYINDITQVTRHKCILFADDISIIVSSDKSNMTSDTSNNSTINDHEIQINNTIKDIIHWLQMNNLLINLDKSNYIQFHKSKHSQYNFQLNIDRIKEVSNTKFLGVILDQDLNWKLHLDNLCNRVNRFAYALNKIKTVTNKKTAVISYRAYVESILRYGIVMWGNSTDIKRVFVAQKKCIRAICGVPADESCKPLFGRLGLLPLPSLYIFEMSVFVMQHKFLFLNAYDVRNRAQRNPHRLVYNDVPKSAKYSKSCIIMCVKIFNKLPNELKSLNINMFKNKLYKWLTENNFYSLQEFLE